MPQYLMVIYSAPGRGPTDAPPPEVHAAWEAYTQRLKDAGLYLGGNALQGTDTATTLREQGGEVQVTDGPFAETKEVLAGYYLVESPDLDTVLEHGKDIPNLQYGGSLEVRPVMELDY
ncbi:MAG TPA: YciI family protein [Solirubrobacteraceae bacterium]|nr:YciI family protein [Solirubrobacteraceae bacterium]